MLKLDKYQLDTIEKTKIRNGKLLISFRPGLGKTATTLTFIKEKEPNYTLILCPKTKIPEWVDDIKNWFPEKKVYVLKSGIYTNLPKGFYISTYQSSPNIQTDIKFDAFILDEVHIVKNPSATIFRSLYSLIKEHKPKIVLGLTGTPMLNNPYELWTQLKLLDYDKNILPSFKDWCDMFVIRKWNKQFQQWQYIGAKNLELLQQIITPFIAVVTSEDAKKEIKLPPLRIHKWEVKNSVDVFIDNLKQCGKLKVIECKNLIKKILTKYPDEQITVFTWHQEVAQRLKKSLLENNIAADYILGNMELNKRQKILTKFKNKELTVLICNIKSAGVGINIQNCKIGIVLELVWSPEVTWQAIKRLHRRGSKDVVNIMILCLENSIDDKILDVWKKKSKIIGKTINLPKTEQIF